MESHLSPVDGDCEAIERSCKFEMIGCSARQVCIKYETFLITCQFASRHLKYISPSQPKRSEGRQTSYQTNGYNFP